MRVARVDAGALSTMAAALLEAVGAPPEPAATTAEQLVRADLEGHSSHGVRLLPDYCARCRSGLIDPAATPRVERDDGSTVMLDGERALGQVAGLLAVDLIVERALAFGVAVVTMRRSGHLGRLASYVERIASAGMVGVLAANDSGANQVVAPFGSLERRLGTNPVAVGIPRPRPPHFVLDMATSAVSHGTVELHRLAGAADPPRDWVLGDVLRPLGGAKGTGLALVVEVLAGVLSGAGFTSERPGVDYQGVWILALDPVRFLLPGQLERDVEQLAGYVGSNNVLIPGEPAARAFHAAGRDGIPLPAAIWERVSDLADELDVSIPDHRYEEAA
jgi:LDH2 family malate/lactate/ureidoglycolate dehydrogenase